MGIGTRVIAGLLAGFAGGAVAGLGESAVIASTSELTEYWLFLFGALTYGAIGSAIGAGWSVLSAIVPSWRSGIGATARSAGLAAALLGLVVARFRVVRDAFGESLPLFSATGIAVHVGLLLGAVVLYALVAGWLRSRASRRGPAAGAAGAAVGTIVLGALLAGVLTTVFGGEAPPAASTAGGAKGPNVVLIIVDTLRADHIGAYGAKNVSTPAMDALAQDGIVFERAFAQSSWTRPSISSIVTGLYPGSHSVMHKTDLLPAEVVTVAESMREAGYRTSGFVTNINVAPSFNFQQGFDEYRYLAPDFFFGATDSGSKLALYSVLRLVRERFLSKEKWVAHYYQDADTVNATALPWIDSYRGDRSFVLVHYMDPHDPYFEIPYNGKAIARVDTPNPAPERAEELRKLYATNIEYFDSFLAKVIAQLEARGLYDDALIVLTADHGEEFHEHGGWWHGTTLYDEQIHVPLIVKLPGNRNAGARESALARSVDIAPTMLTISGAGVPAAVQGRNLFGTAPAPTAIYAEEDHEGNVLEAIRTAEWKLILANPGNPRGLAEVELYDLVADPGERKNLADAEPARVTELKKNLETLRAASRASAVSGVSGAIDDADMERLKALGYVDE
jgi:arylsulfatase A-like enzyme